MEDRRVRKTKKNIKQTMIRLLGEKPFDDITVTELCETADMSRITFYTHYADKFELIDEMFQELQAVAIEDFKKLQASNNTMGDPLQGYANLLDSIIDLYESNTLFLRQMSRRRNPYLYSKFYQYIYANVKKRVEAENKKYLLRLGSGKFTAFLCNGLWAYIDECYQENCDIKALRGETQALLKSLLTSDIFMKQTGR